MSIGPTGGSIVAVCGYRQDNMARSLIVFIALFAGPLSLPAAPARADRYSEVPRGKVFVPGKLFNHRKSTRDKLVMAANPRIYVYPDHDPREKEHTLVIGMPGWGGRSETFIWTLINGLKLGGPTRSLVVAAIQDMKTGGPTFQGQGGSKHANVWGLHTETISGMHHFIRRMSDQFGPLRIYFLGYSSGGVTAPRLAIRMAQWARKGRYSIGGGIAVGPGSPVTAKGIKTFKVPVLFIVVPEVEPRDADGGPIHRTDQRNRRHAERIFDRLIKEDADAHLRYIFSARRHNDWHWGLLSQCRYFPPGTRVDANHGYWPNYWLPNPETYKAIVPFIMGQAPPSTLDGWKPTKCPN